MTEGLPRKGAPTTDQVTPRGSPVAEKETAPEVLIAEAGGVSAMAMGLAVPETLTTWGELGALSVRVRVSESWPEAVPAGAKVSEIVHVALAMRAAPLHPLVSVKSAGLLPPKATEAIFRVPVPELVMVTEVGPLVEPWVVAGKLTELGEIMMAGMGGVVWICPPPQPAAKKNRESTQRERARNPKSRFFDK